jgi:dTDP-glucose 4,6-dehydratase
MAVSSQRVLVTGGCGFIGSTLIRRLLAVSPPLARLVNLDALTYAGRLDNLDEEVTGDPRYRFVQARVEDPAAVRTVIREEGIDAVLHLAAESHVDRSLRTPQVFVATNVVGTSVLLEAALRSGTVRRFLLLSTDEVYGPTPEGQRFGEAAPLAPTSPYAASKAAADLLTLAYARSYGLDTIVVRSSNNLGPRQFPEKLVPLAILNAIEGVPIPIYGDGLQRRDWIHVEDCCDALCALLERGRPGAVYNLASGEARTNLELVQGVLSRLGLPIEPSVQHVPDRPSHDRCYQLDCARLRRELGWQPRFGFESALDATVAWYRDHRLWWRAVSEEPFRTYYREQYGRERAPARSEDP